MARSALDMAIDAIEAVADPREREARRTHAPLYDPALGNPLYQNPLPPLGTIPPNAVVALVNFECDHCHAALHGTGYPTHTPDGRRIIYIDMHNPHPEQGDTPAIAYYRSLGLSGNVPWEHVQLNGRDVPGANVPFAAVSDIVHFPILLDVNDQGQIAGTFSAGVANMIERFDQLRGRPLSQQVSTASQSTNTDIAGDTTLQSNYMALPPWQRDMVDRAIYSEVMTSHRDGEPYAFTTTILRQFGGQPNTQQIEQEIERRRETYALSLRQGDPALEQRLNGEARGVPDATLARLTLNYIIREHGDECGCMDEPPPPINLNETLAPLASYRPAGPSGNTQQR